MFLHVFLTRVFSVTKTQVLLVFFLHQTTRKTQAKESCKTRTFAQAGVVFLHVFLTRVFSVTKAQVLFFFFQLEQRGKLV